MHIHTKHKGIIGEYIACFVMLLKGYRILEMRYKTFCGEIDLIAKKGNLIVFIEVKSRKSMEQCYDAIREKQIRRIQNASYVFLKKHPQFSGYYSRYDVILVADWKIPKHIQNITM